MADFNKILLAIPEHRQDAAQLQSAFSAHDHQAVARLQPRELSDGEKRQNAQNWLRKCAVPAAYLHCSKDSWRPRWRGHPTPFPAEAEQWDGKPWCLTLVGAPGGGKTHVAVSVSILIARAAMLAGIYDGQPPSFKFVSVPSVVRDIRDDDMASDYDKKRLRSAVRGWMKSFDLIILDDVGAQPDKDNWMEEVSAWVYERHARLLPTIITLNPEDQRGLEDRGARRVNDGLVVYFEAKESQNDT